MKNIIEKHAELSASVDDVWRILTDSKEFGTWFMVTVDKPFCVGEISKGRITYPGYEHIQWEVQVCKMEPNELFSFTWHPYAVDQNLDYSSEMPTLVEFKLAPLLVGTHLSIVESGFDNLPVTRRAEAFRMNNHGWDEQIENIKKYLNGRVG